MDKSTLRQQNRDRLGELSANEMALFDAQIVSYFLTSQIFMPQSVIACYMPLKGEVSCNALMHTLHKQGHTLCLPAVIDRTSPLIFRQYKPGDPLVRGKVGSMEPTPEARLVNPDVLIVPVIGFNRRGQRLGYGTGFYDRTLPVLRQQKPIRAIGLAYSIQECDDLPTEDHDEKLDLIITEKEIIQVT